MSAKILDDLCNWHGTDKGSKYPGASRHGYANIYDQPSYLSNLIDDSIRFLEVGVALEGTLGGQSLRVWLDYFSKAKLYAFDIVDMSQHPVIKDNSRIEFYRGDQGNRDDFRKMYEHFGNEPFDVILEDGSHQENHQMISLGALFPFVKAGGLYILEDMSIADRPCCCTRNDASLVTMTNFKNDRTINSPHLTDEEKLYIEEHTESIEIYEDIANAYSVALLRKKI